MATDLENLQAIKRDALVKIAEMTANPKPNYEIDGQEMDWGDLLGSLQKLVEWADKQMQAEETDGKPYEVITVPII